MFIIGITNLLNSANEQTEATDDDQLQKAKKGRAIQVNKKIDDRFHAGQGQYEGSTHVAPFMVPFTASANC